MQQISFSAGLRPDPLGELTTLPQTLYSWTEDICYTTSTLLFRKAL